MGGGDLDGDEERLTRYKGLELSGATLLGLVAGVTLGVLLVAVCEVFEGGFACCDWVAWVGVVAWFCGGGLFEFCGW